MNLKIEDVKIGDKLVCIDEDAWINGFSANRKLLSKEYVVFSISKNNEYVFISDNQLTSESILSKELKYFKKKEQSQYTFDDLIDVVIKAKNDGVIDGSTLIFNDGYNDRYVDCNASEDKIKQEIDFIQSLYKETFVIESEDDLKRVNLNPKITLNNGETIPFTFKAFAKDHLIFYDQTCGHNLIPFVFLKGATVEQDRGCSE